MKRFSVVFWTYAVSWVFSALLHVVDSDVGGIGGLWEASVLFSVSVVALLFTAPVWLAIAAYWRRGWKLFYVVVLVLAVGMGSFVAVLSSGVKGKGVIGLTALFGLAILVASSIPVLASGRKKKAESSLSRQTQEGTP